MPVALNDKGLLPAGLHEYTLVEVAQQFAFTAKRKWLLAELRSFIARSVLAKASHELWIDGSFAESKPEPRDVDVLFVQHRNNLTAEVLVEIRKLSRISSRAQLKKLHGIDFNQIAVEEDMYPDFFSSWYGFHCDWSLPNPQPVPKGIILVRL